MNVKYSKRQTVKPIDAKMVCINCGMWANTEDIKFGCAKCEQNNNATPDNYWYQKDWKKGYIEGGGWYEYRGQEYENN